MIFAVECDNDAQQVKCPHCGRKYSRGLIVACAVRGFGVNIVRCECRVVLSWLIVPPTGSMLEFV